MLSFGADALRPGYQKLHEQNTKLRQRMLTAGFIAPVVATGWIYLTKQPLKESPVALAAVAVGAIVVGDALLQQYRLGQLVRWSAALQPTRVLKSGAAVTGGVSLTQAGIVVDPTVPAPSVTAVHAEMGEAWRLTLPTCVLNEQARKVTAHVQDRWLTRVILPINVLNFFFQITAKKDQRMRKADDVVVVASSMVNILDYFAGDSVATARAAVTAHLTQRAAGRDAEGALASLVQPELLEDGLCCLPEWLACNANDRLRVRVGRTGAVVLYNGVRDESWCGPYPIACFPIGSEAGKLTENSAPAN